MPKIEFQSLPTQEKEELFSVIIDGEEQDYFLTGISYSVPNQKIGGSFIVFTCKCVDKESGRFYYALNFNGWVSPNRDDWFKNPIWIITVRKQGVVTRIPGLGKVDFPWPKIFEEIAKSF